MRCARTIYFITRLKKYNLKNACVLMPTHCTITSFWFPARWIDGVECGLFSNHAPLGQTTLRVVICIVYYRKLSARLSRSGPGFDPRSGQVSWVRFFRGFSSPVRQMSGSFRPTRSPNIIWPSLLSLVIHSGANDLRC